MFTDDYIKIEFKDTLLIIKHMQYGIVKNSRVIDIFEITEKDKTVIRTVLKHYKDLPLITTYEELQYLRKCGIRI